MQYHTHRLRVPDDDEKSVLFVQQQKNLSTSLRILMQRYVDEHGCVDVLSSSAGGKKEVVPVTETIVQQAPVTQQVVPTQVPQTTQQVNTAAQIAAMQGTPMTTVAVNPQDMLNN